MTTAPNGELRRQDFHLQVQQLVSLRSLPQGLFKVARIVEQHRQTDTAGSQVRRRVIGREQHQGLEKPEHHGLLALGELRKCLPGGLRFSPVAQNHFLKINTAAIMAIRGR